MTLRARVRREARRVIAEARTWPEFEARWPAIRDEFRRTPIGPCDSLDDLDAVVEQDLWNAYVTVMTR